LWRASRNGMVRNTRMAVPFLGPAPSLQEIDEALVEFQDRIQALRFSTLREACASAAELIRDGRVIAWYRGRMEYGPRALGHWSILADPGRPEMRDRINAMVKMREAFRPFAPAVSLEQVQDWFMTPPGTTRHFLSWSSLRESVQNHLSDLRCAWASTSRVRKDSRGNTRTRWCNLPTKGLPRQVDTVSFHVKRDARRQRWVPRLERAGCRRDWGSSRARGPLQHHPGPCGENLVGETPRSPRPRHFTELPRYYGKRPLHWRWQPPPFGRTVLPLIANIIPSLPATPKNHSLKCSQGLRASSPTDLRQLCALLTFLGRTTLWGFRQSPSSGLSSDQCERLNATAVHHRYQRCWAPWLAKASSASRIAWSFTQTKARRSTGL